MSIIVSDIEGTLTTGSSWRALRQYYRANYDPWEYNRFFLRWVPRYLFVTLGLMSRRTAMVAWMVDEIRLFRGFSEEEFVHMAEWIVSTEMWPNRRREILLELEEHRSNGNQIVLVSSGYQPIVQAFAECLNATAIGSTLDYRNGKLWDVSLPINAYEHKAKSIREKYPKFMIKAAYGDSGSDISMMELSQMPVAINPDKELRRIAKTRGWRIVPCPP